jgi:hypothetical protein
LERLGSGDGREFWIFWDCALHDKKLRTDRWEYIMIDGEAAGDFEERSRKIIIV